MYYSNPSYSSAMRLLADAKSTNGTVVTSPQPTSLAAWEALFDRLRIPQEIAGARSATLLVLGAAGGVGSMAIQLAAQFTNLYVVATASRAASREHCLTMGAHAVIDHTAPLDMNLLRAKSLSFSWEGMFTRAIFKTADMAAQQDILRQVAQAVDTGVLKTTLTQHLGPIDAQHLMQAHALLATQHSVGKIVLG